MTVSSSTWCRTRSKGDPHGARVYFLSTNPSPEGYTESPKLRKARLSNLRHEGEPPFPTLWPEFQQDAGWFWLRSAHRGHAHRGVFGQLVNDGVTREALMRRAMVVQYFPYWSRSGAGMFLGLPSQEYSFSLIRDAIEQEKLVVVLRLTHWPAAIRKVPELERGRRENVIWKKSMPSMHVSPPVLGPDAYERVRDALSGY